MGFTMDRLRARLGKRSYCIAIRGQEPLWKRIQIIFFLTLRSVHTSRQVAETCCGDRSPRVCTGPATSCSNMLRRHIAATHRSDKSLRVYWRVFVKVFLSATEFCRSNMLQKIKSDRICATYRGDKILLQRQRFSQISPVHSKRCVAATCCCN